MIKIQTINFRILLCFHFFLCCIVSGYAATVRVDKNNIRYSVDNVAMTAEVYGPVSSSTVIIDLVIPDFIEYESNQIPVTSIKSSAFSSNKNLKGSLIIGDNVQKIGDYAFAGCSGFNGSLTIGNKVQNIGYQAFNGCSGFIGLLNIPGKVQTIGNYAFRECSGFTGSLKIPDSVQTIGNSAFRGCSGFTGTLTIGKSVQTIGNNAFSGCSGFTGSLTIGNSVQTIGNSAFEGCSGFTGSLEIPTSVQTIGNYAFYECSGFDGTLTLPNTLKEIPSSAFYSCSGFTGSLEIPNSVQTIGSYAFYDCSGFTGSLEIPTSVQTIGDFAFNGCKGFDGTLTLPNTLKEIPRFAFYDCSGFTGSLVIPTSVQTIGSAAFYDCSGFTGSLEIPNSVDTIGDSAFRGCKGFDGTLTLPNTLKEISSSAFLFCSGFTGSLEIPTSVQTIGSYAFSACSGFTGTLVIPTSVQTIGSSAFSGCKGFDGTLTLPNTLKEIPSSAFSGCSGFTGLVIPESVDTIEYRAFSDCSNLKSITCLGTAPPECVYKDSYNYVFSNYTIPLYVPSRSISLYKEATEWSKFNNITSIPVPAEEISLTSISLEGIEGKTEFKATESFRLIATITPEDAIFEKILWSAGQENLVTITPDNENATEVTVTIKEGVKAENLVITATVEQPEPVSATFTLLSITDLLLGDANDNGSVNVSDVVTVRNEILSKGSDTPSPNKTFSFINSDIDLNKIIDVIDQAAITNLALGRPAFSESMAFGADAYSNDCLTADNFKTGASTIGFDLHGAGRYVILQADVVLPAGMELISVEAGPKAASHTVMYSSLGNNSCRVMAYSLSNTPFSDEEGELFRLNVNCPAPEGDITVSNIIAGDVSVGRHELEFRGGKYESGQSGVEDVTATSEVIGATGEIIIRNAEGAGVEVYSIDGLLVKRTAATENPTSIGVPGGLYIVIVDGVAHKVLVK